jgi:antitoxin component YwqK of YwqJK toxin-antitoxin module
MADKVVAYNKSGKVDQESQFKTRRYNGVFKHFLGFRSEP